MGHKASRQAAPILKWDENDPSIFRIIDCENKEFIVDISELHDTAQQLGVVYDPKTTTFVTLCKAIRSAALKAQASGYEVEEKVKPLLSTNTFNAAPCSDLAHQYSSSEFKTYVTENPDIFSSWMENLTPNLNGAQHIWNIPMACSIIKSALFSKKLIKGDDVLTSSETKLRAAIAEMHRRNKIKRVEKINQE